MVSLPVVDRRLLLAGGAVLLVVLVVLGVVAWRSWQTTDLERAAGMVPEQTARMTYVDWAAVRAEVDPGVSGDSSWEETSDFLDEGFATDLTMPSALRESAQVLHEEYGLSPADLAWESLAQSEDGVVLTLAPEGGVDEGLGDRLADLGYERPDEDDGVWAAGGSGLAEIEGVVSPVLQYLVVLEGEGLVLASDREGYLGTARDAVRGEGALEPGDAVAAAGEVTSAVSFLDGHACGALAMSQADPDAREIGDSLVDEAGQVHPYDDLVAAALPDGDLRVTFGFADGEQARTNATTRSRLASGPAPGQGGDFGDRFRVESATASGSVVTLDLAPRDGAAYTFSDITSGPVLFATC